MEQNNSTRNWLITGGCGFLGVSLIGRLLQAGGQRIRVVDNLSVGTREDLNTVCRFEEISITGLSARTDAAASWGEGVHLIVGDILDETLALHAAAGADVIVHFAANTGVGPSVENPRMDCVTNVIGTFNYLEAARQNRVLRFIFASSGAPAGEIEPPIHEEMAPHPVSPYGASKLAGEGYCSAYYRTYGIETICLRFGNVYGPGSAHKSSVIAKFIRRALLGEPLEVYGDGTQTRDFIYIDDLIDAVIRVSSVSGIGGEIFQIASNRETTVGEIAERLIAALGNAGVSGVRLVNAETRLGDVKRNFSDTTKARTRLGWQPTITLDVGLHNTIDYFVNKEVDYNGSDVSK